VTIREALQRALDERAYTYVRTGERGTRGFVVGVGDTLLLFQRFNDFVPYGYLIVRLPSIHEVDSDGPDLRFFGSMMAAEGLSPARPDFIVPLDSLQAALRSIQQRGILVELQQENFDGEWGVEVGRLLDVYEQHTVLQLVSASGEWEDGECVLETPAVWRVVLATAYVEALQKYSGDPMTPRRHDRFRVRARSGLRESLQRALELRAYAWIETAGYRTMGFVIGVTDQLVLIHSFFDLADDGFVLIPTHLVGEVSWDGENPRFFGRMMEGEQLLDGVGHDIPVRLDSLPHALQAIRDQELLVQVDDRDEAHVGRLVESDDARTTLRYLSASGVWEDVREVETAHIVRVGFGNAYLRAFAKYASQPEGAS